MSEIKDISVVYSDNTIKKTLIWDNTEIHKTNDIYTGKSLAKFGDVLAEAKKEVNRNEYFSMVEAFEWVYKVNGLKNTYMENWKYKEKKIRANIALYRSSLKNAKKRGDNVIPLKKIGVYRRNVTNAICLADWEHNRKILIDTIENNKNSISTKAYYYKLHSQIGCWFWCLDYFFSHVKEYKLDKKIFVLEWNAKIDILNTPPSSNDKLYFFQRITKNRDVWTKAFYTLSGAQSKTKNHNKLGTLETKQYGSIKLFFKQAHFRTTKKEVIVMSYRQIEALIWLLTHFNNFVLNKIKENSVLKVGIETLRDFLKRPKYYEEKYDCLYIENKTYRSLWL